MLRKKTIIILLALTFGALLCYGETIEVRVRMRNDSSDEKVVNTTNLTQIKKFIIKKGLRRTFSQMYNNNPAYQTKRFEFYLIPDTGQQNINCEIDKSDFQTLVIRDSKRKNQYCDVAFKDKFNVYISVPWPTGDLTISQIREFAAEAIKEILSETEKETPIAKQETKSGTDIRNLQDAVNIAVSSLADQNSLRTGDYMANSAQQIIVNNKYIWRITFKPKKLLPDNPSKNLIGAGGEIFVNVDLTTKKAEIRYGE